MNRSHRRLPAAGRPVREAIVRAARVLLAAAGAALLITGCADDTRLEDEVAGQLAEIDSLARENAELAERSAALSDSLDRLVSGMREMMDEVKRQRRGRALAVDDRVGLWEPGPDAMSVRFARPVAAGTLQDLVDAFNERFSPPYHPRVRLLAVEGGTARVGLDDDEQLTERMGSTGSRMYTAALTFTLTSFPGIDGVFLDIRPGSHAGPDYLTRERSADLVRED